MPTAISAALVLSNPTGADPEVITPTTGDTNKNTFTASPTLLLIARNAHATLAKTLTFDNAAGEAQDAVSLAAGEVAAFGPFDPEDWGATVSVDCESTDIKYVLLDATPNLTAKGTAEFAQAAVDAARDNAATAPGPRKALKRLARACHVAIRRITEVNPDPLNHF